VENSWVVFVLEMHMKIVVELMTKVEVKVWLACSMWQCVISYDPNKDNGRAFYSSANSTQAVLALVYRYLVIVK
jgi:hypothetical protein